MASTLFAYTAIDLEDPQKSFSKKMIYECIAGEYRLVNVYTNWLHMYQPRSYMTGDIMIPEKETW